MSPPAGVTSFCHGAVRGRGPRETQPTGGTPEPILSEAETRGRRPQVASAAALPGQGGRTGGRCAPAARGGPSRSPAPPTTFWGAQRRRAPDFLPLGRGAFVRRRKGPPTGCAPGPQGNGTGTPACGGHTRQPEPRRAENAGGPRATSAWARPALRCSLGNAAVQGALGQPQAPCVFPGPPGRVWSHV